MDILDTVYLGNPISQWLSAAIAAIGIFFLFLITRHLLRRYFSRQSDEKASPAYKIAEILSRQMLSPIACILSIYAGALMLDIASRLVPWITSIALVTIIVQVAIWATSMVNFWISHYQAQHIETNAARVTTMRTVGFTAKLGLLVIATLLILDNIPGVEITALIAGLGIGGIAVALAVQNILADIFASLSIVFDKPFVLGDFIIVDSYLGSVEYIGLKTTRIRSLSGEQLVFSNTDLLNSRIRNYKRMAERRVVFSFGVTYQTPCEKLQLIPTYVKDIIDAQEPVRFDRAHFKEYGDFALNFEIVYYVLDPDYNIYMDIQQAVNLAILQKFEEEKIDFAYPTRTLYLQSDSMPQVSA